MKVTSDNVSVSILFCQKGSSRGRPFLSSDQLTSLFQGQIITLLSKPQNGSLINLMLDGCSMPPSFYEFFFEVKKTR